MFSSLAFFSFSELVNLLCSALVLDIFLSSALLINFLQNLGLFLVLFDSLLSFVNFNSWTQ